MYYCIKINGGYVIEIELDGPIWLADCFENAERFTTRDSALNYIYAGGVSHNDAEIVSYDDYMGGDK